MNLKSAFEQYLDECLAFRDLSPSTVNSYRNRFQSFLDFHKKNPDIDLETAFSSRGITQYFAWLGQKNYELTTLYVKKQVVITFRTWAYERGWVSEKIDIQLKHPPKPRTVYLTRDEANRMEQAAARGTNIRAILHLRDQAAFNLLYKTDIPIAKLSTLSIDDYNAEAGTLRIAPNVILLNDNLCELINAYLCTQESGPMLFISRTGNPWRPTAIRKAIYRHRATANLPPLEKGAKVHPRHWPSHESERFIQTSVSLYENSIEQAQLVLGLGLYCGLRRGEMVRLKARDVDLYNRQLYIVGKGGQARVIFLNSHMLSLLQPIVHSRKPDQPILIKMDGSALPDKRINSIVSVLSEKAGITYKKITPHTLRHTFATWLNEQGTSIRIIQDLMGHSRLEETARYVHPSKDHMIEAVEGLVQV